MDHRFPPGSGTRIVLKKAEHDHEKATVGRSDGAPVLTLGTDDVRAAYEELRGRGVRFLGEPYRYPWGLAAILLDQDGSPVLLQQEAGRYGRWLDDDHEEENMHGRDLRGRASRARSEDTSPFMPR